MISPERAVSANVESPLCGECSLFSVVHVT
jgi:hypothetical protein